MTQRVNLPQPLFDTLANLEAMPYPCIIDYLQHLTLPDIVKQYTLAKEFLLSYAGAPDTFVAYRREIERLLHWAWKVKGLALKQLTRNELREYIEFAVNPPVSWIATKNVARFMINEAAERIPNPEWRPFVVKVSKAQRFHGSLPDRKNYKLSNKSLQALFACLGTFFNFLQQEEYMEHNPVTLIRQKNRYLQRTQRLKVTRKLSPLQWKFVIEVAERLADAHVENERILFMMSAFYLLGLRISELAETPGRYPKMSDFAPDKRGLWWFITVGKGNKLRDIAVPDAMLAALRRYRLSLGLTPLPARGEDTPLLNKMRGSGGLGARQIRNLIQKCFDLAEERLRRENQIDAADDLRAATVHWLRHTAISADIEFRPREHVRDDAGHNDPATTERYIDVDRVARHQSAQHKVLKPD